MAPRSSHRMAFDWHYRNLNRAEPYRGPVLSGNVFPNRTPPPHPPPPIPTRAAPPPPPHPTPSRRVASAASRLLERHVRMTFFQSRVREPAELGRRHVSRPDHDREQIALSHRLGVRNLVEIELQVRSTRSRTPVFPKRCQRLLRGSIWGASNPWSDGFICVKQVRWC